MGRMLGLAPLQALDNFLQNYTIGQAVLLLFLLSIPAGLVRKSRKILSLNFIVFGLLFVIVPSIGGGPRFYAFVGVSLLVLGPLLFTTADR